MIKITDRTAILYDWNGFVYSRQDELALQPESQFRVHWEMKLTLHDMII